MAVHAPTDKRFRRAHVSPTGGRKVSLSPGRLIIATLLTVVAVSMCYYAATLAVSSDMLTVTHVTVSGNWRLSDGEVMSQLDGRQGRDRLTVDHAEWRD